MSPIRPIRPIALLVLALVSCAIIAPAQTNPPFIVDTTTRHTNGTSVIIGDTLPAAFAEVNSNALWFQGQIGSNSTAIAALQTNGSGGAGSNYLTKTGGTGTALTITNSFTLTTNVVTSWKLFSVSVTNYPDCHGSSNSVYVLDLDTNSTLYGYLTNGCTNIFMPITFTNIGNLLSNVLTDPDTSNYLSGAGLLDPSNIIVDLYVGQLVRDLKTNGLWTNFFAVYPVAAGTVTGDVVNLIPNTNYTLVWTGFMATASAHGVWGISNNGTVSSGGDTHIIESSLSPSVLNDFSFMAWNAPIQYTGGWVMGYNWLMGYDHFNSAGTPHDDPSTMLQAYTNASGYYFFSAVNQSTLGWTPPQAYLTNSGFIAASRQSSSTYMTYSDGYLTNYISSSSSLPNLDFYICGIDFVNTTGGGVVSVTNIYGAQASMGFVAIGRGFSPYQLGTLKGIVDNYDAWRPSAFYPYYYNLPGAGGSSTNTGPGGTNAWCLWQPFTTNCWLLACTVPSCGFGGPCFSGPVLMGAGTKQWYVMASYYTNTVTDPGLTNAIIFFQTH